MILQSSGIETPVRVYQHPDTKSRVDLIGTVHHAEPGYYRQIQDIIDTRTAGGATTHYEMVSAVSQAEFDAAPRRVRRTLHYLTSLQICIDTFAKKAGLVSQQEALVLSGNSERHDTDELTLGAKINPYALGALALMMRTGNVLASIVPAEARRQIIIDALYNGDNSSDSFLSRALDVSSMASVLDDRNEATLAAADVHFAEHPQIGLLLPWGAEHIAGLSAGFEQRGFEKTAEYSLVAIHSQIPQP
jgi:hypothetical protein